MTDQTAFALLGALVALLVVLVVFAIFVGTVTTKALGYAARFKGFQAGRNDANEMTFTAKIDETPAPPPRQPSIRLSYRGATKRRERTQPKPEDAATPGVTN